METAFRDNPGLFGNESFYETAENRGMSYPEFLLMSIKGVNFRSTSSLRRLIPRVDTSTFIEQAEGLGLPTPDLDAAKKEKPMNPSEFLGALRATGITVLDAAAMVKLPLRSGDRIRIQGKVTKLAKETATLQLSAMYGGAALTLAPQIMSYVNRELVGGQAPIGNLPSYYNSYATGPADKLYFVAVLEAIMLADERLKNDSLSPEEKKSTETLRSQLVELWKRLVGISRTYLMGAPGNRRLFQRLQAVTERTSELRSLYLLYSVRPSLRSALLKVLGSNVTSADYLTSYEVYYNRVMALTVPDRRGWRAGPIKKFLQSQAETGDAKRLRISDAMIKGWNQVADQVGFKVANKFPVRLAGHPMRILLDWFLPGLLRSDSGGEEKREPLPFQLFKVAASAEAGPLYGKGQTLGLPDVGPGIPLNAERLLDYFKRNNTQGLLPLPEVLQYITTAYAKRKIEAVKKSKGTRIIYVLSADATLVWRMVEAVSMKCAPTFMTNIDTRSLSKIAWVKGGLMRLLARCAYSCARGRRNHLVLRYADNLFIYQHKPRYLASLDGVKFEGSHTRLSMALELIRRLTDTFDATVRATSDRQSITLEHGELVESHYLQYILAAVQTVDGVSVINDHQFVARALMSGLPFTFSANDALMGQVQYNVEAVLNDTTDISTWNDADRRKPPPPIQFCAELVGCKLTFEKLTDLDTKGKLVDLDLLGMGYARVRIGKFDMRLAVLDSERFDKQTVFHKAFVGLEDLEKTVIMYPFVRYMIGMSSYLLRGFADAAQQETLMLYMAKAVKEIRRLVTVRNASTGVNARVLENIIRIYFDGFIPADELENFFSVDYLADAMATPSSSHPAPSVPQTPSDSQLLLQSYLHSLLNLKLPSLHFAMGILAPSAGFYLLPRLGYRGDPTAVPVTDNAISVVGYDQPLEVDPDLVRSDETIDTELRYRGMQIFKKGVFELHESLKIMVDFASYGAIDSYFHKFRESARFPMALPRSNHTVYLDYFTTHYACLNSLDSKDKLQGGFHSYLTKEQRTTVISGLASYNQRERLAFMAATKLMANGSGTAAIQRISSVFPAETAERAKELVQAASRDYNAASLRLKEVKFLVPEGALIGRGTIICEIPYGEGQTHEVKAPNAGIIRNLGRSGRLCDLEPWTDAMFAGKVASSSRAGPHFAGLYFFESLDLTVKGMCISRHRAVASALSDYFAVDRVMNRFYHGQMEGARSDVALHVVKPTPKPPKEETKNVVTAEQANLRPQQSTSMIKPGPIAVIQPIPEPIKPTRVATTQVMTGPKVVEAAPKPKATEISKEQWKRALVIIKGWRDSTSGSAKVRFPNYLNPIGLVDSKGVKIQRMPDETFLKLVLAGLGPALSMNSEQYNTLYQRLWAAGKLKDLPVTFVTDPFLTRAKALGSTDPDTEAEKLRREADVVASQKPVTRTPGRRRLQLAHEQPATRRKPPASFESGRRNKAKERTLRMKAARKQKEERG
jgi:hypothetical protein